MRAVDIIEKKKIGKELSEEEINFFIQSFHQGKIPDYQLSALLMTIYFNSMTDLETYYLTKAFIDSGETYSFAHVSQPIVDKHSTGGVGDKVSLALGPLLASLGIGSAKLSGRGLGFTGGTVDKLEAIENFSFLQTEKDMENSLLNSGFGIMQASPTIIPVEKKVYNLRDVTGTINAYPLMVSSILAKKLALRSDLIVIDLKVGNGAFIKTVEEAKVLASKMKKVTDLFGRELICVLTSMDEVLGYAVGNALEVKEAQRMLAGQTDNNFSRLVKELAVLIYQRIFPNSQLKEIKELVDNKINSGEALEKWKEFVEFCSGKYTENPWCIFDLNRIDIQSSKKGFLNKMFTENIGLLSMKLGAGREKKEETIHAHAGIIMHKQIGDPVEENEIICSLYYPQDRKLDISLNVKDYFVISDEETKALKPIIDII
jgi:pyrimidine-nucleoside phosphorylase